MRDQVEIKRKFIWTEDDNGNEGWMCMWMPKSDNFNTVEGLGMLHDMLEHLETDTGTWANELSAFGRIVVTRMRSNIPKKTEEMNKQDAEELVRILLNHQPDISEDLYAVCEHEYASKITDEDYPEHEYRIKGTAEGIASGLWKTCEESIFERLDNYTGPGVTQEQFAKRVEGWLRYGYHTGVDFYGSVVSMEEAGGYMFDDWTVKEFNKKLPRGSYQDVMEVTIIPNNQEWDFHVFDSDDYPREEVDAWLEA